MDANSLRTNSLSIYQSCDISLTHPDHNLAVEESANVKGEKMNPFLAERIKSAFNSDLFLYQKTEEEQNLFSFFLANELNKNLNDISKHNVAIHYSKRTEYVLADEKIKPLFTFYLTVDPIKEAQISINNPKSEIIRGSFKKIFKGCKFFVPCANSFTRSQIGHSKKAIARFLNPEDSNDLIKGLITHQKIYELLKHEPFSGHIALPPVLREHKKFGSQEIKYEFEQDFYPGDMFKVLVAYRRYPSEKEGDKEVELDLTTMLTLVNEVFQGIHLLNRTDGYVHQDIKCENIFLKKEYGKIHAYISDFDFALNKLVDFQKEYEILDLAGQMGLFSHYTDIVSAMYLTVLFLYRYSAEENDPNHFIFKDPDNPVDVAFSSIVEPYIKERLNDMGIDMNSDPSFADLKIEYLEGLANDPNKSLLKSNIKDLVIEAKVGFKLMSLFCQYFAKEMPWKEKLLGSIAAYFCNVSAEEYERMSQSTIFAKFKKGYENHIKKRLFEELEIDKEISYSNFSLEQFLHGLSPKYYGMEKYGEIFMDIYKNFNLFSRIKQEDLPKTGDSELYRLLSSNDSLERAKGREISYRFFGRALELHQEIHKIIEEIKMS